MCRILWGWVQETRPREAIDAAGWSGCVSLPRVLTLGPDGELEMQVASEFDSLLTNTVAIQQPHDPRTLSDALARAVIRGRAGEIRCTFKVGESSCGLNLRFGSKTENVPFLRIAYDGANDRPMLAVDDKVVPLSPDGDGHSSLRIWIDGSVVETFVDKRQAITTRFYAATVEPAEINVAWAGAIDSLQSLIVSGIKPISDDRLTS
jgi:beta-fructofuranosidase